MEKELDKIIEVLKDGKDFSRVFPHERINELKEAHLRFLRRPGAVDFKKLSPLVEAVLSYAHRNGFGITNAGGPESIFDPLVDKSQRYRPFAANRVKENNVFRRVQKLLWNRLAERIGGAWIFPAAGLDAELFGAKRVITIGPYESMNVPHVRKKAEEVSPADVEEAKARHGLEKDNVLVLKGLQNILSGEKLEEFIERFKPLRVIVFGSAANGVIEPEAKGIPTISKELVSLLSKRYRDATLEFFSPEEIHRLETIHSIGYLHFAWGGGHFPATQVMVFERRE